MDHDYKEVLGIMDEMDLAFNRPSTTDQEILDACDNFYAHCSDTIRSALEIARKLQEGYTLVPNEPTEEMIKRGCDKFLSFGRGSNGICNAYRTMITAAQETRKG